MKSILFLFFIIILILLTIIINLLTTMKTLVMGCVTPYSFLDLLQKYTTEPVKVKPIELKWKKLEKFEVENKAISVQKFIKLSPADPRNSFTQALPTTPVFHNQPIPKSIVI